MMNNDRITKKRDENPKFGILQGKCNSNCLVTTETGDVRKRDADLMGKGWKIKCGYLRLSSGKTYSSIYR